MLCLTCTMISGIDLARYRASRAKDLGIWELWNTVKRIRKFYGKIPGNQLPVHFPLFLRPSACRSFLEIKIW